MSIAKRKLYLFLKIFISFSLIGLLFWMMRGDLGRIVLTIKNANLIFLIFAFLLYVFAVVIMGLRLVKVLSVQDIRLTMKEGTYLCFLGYFFNNFFPTSIGGDVIKAYYAGKKFNRKGAAFSGVLMDRLLAMLPFTLIPTCALVFMYKKISNPAIIYFVITMFAFTLLLLVVLLNKRIALFFRFLIKPFKSKGIYQKIIKAYDSLNIYRHHRMVLTWSFSLSLISQVLFVISFFFLARSAGVNNIPLGIFFLLVPITCVIGMLPSINGLGVREAGIVYMFKDYIPASTAFAVSLLILAALLGLSLIGAFIYAFKKDIYSFKPEPEGEIS